MKYNKKMSFIHHVLKPIWSTVFGFMFFIKALFFYIISDDHAKRYYKNLHDFEWPLSIKSFAQNFKNIYKYNWDGDGKIVEWLKKKRDKLVETYPDHIFSQRLKIEKHIKRIEKVIKFFTLLHGILDHDNWALEYFVFWGDFDNVNHIVTALKDKKYYAYRIGIIGDKINTWHYDCIIEISKIIEPLNYKLHIGFDREIKYILFNYGNIIYGSSIEDCLIKLSESKSLPIKYNPETMSYWKCKY